MKQSSLLTPPPPTTADVNVNSPPPPPIDIDKQFAKLTSAVVRKYTLPTDLMPHDGLFVDTIEALSSSDNFVEIFNPDKKRSQRLLPSTNFFLQSIIVPALDRLGFLRCRRVGQAFVLSSKKGCRPQPFHVDFAPLSFHGLRRKPLACLFALEKEGTEFWCVEKGVEKHLSLKQGEFVVFDGDLIHAGAAYAKKNVRIHLYIDVNGVEIGDETFLVDMQEYSEYLKRFEKQIKEIL